MRSGLVAARHFDDLFFHAGTQTFCPAQDSRRVGVAAYGHELLSADAARQVATPHRGAHDLRHMAKYGIADMVAMAVIDAL